MSRIGKLPLAVPSGVDVTLNDSTVVVKGPKGTLSQRILPVVDVNIAGAQVLVARKNDDKSGRSAHALRRTLASNWIEGATRASRKPRGLRASAFASTRPATT